MEGNRRSKYRIQVYMVTITYKYTRVDTSIHGNNTSIQEYIQVYMGRYKYTRDTSVPNIQEHMKVYKRIYKGFTSKDTVNMETRYQTYKYT